MAEPGSSRGARLVAATKQLDSWRERESGTQARSREHNESTTLARASAPTNADRPMNSFRCECGDQSCTSAIRLTLAEYESVRGYATRFAIARNHENPESEQLIEEHERFAVVETVSGEAVKLARRSDPRQRRRSIDPARSGSDRR